MEYPEKIVDFYTYCDKCMYRNNKENEKPCDECLGTFVMEYSRKPIKFKERSE